MIACAALCEAGEKKRIDSELWHACAGPLISLPPVGSLVVYFPQGHSEQVLLMEDFQFPAVLPKRYFHLCPSEFVIPFAKYNKAMYTQVSLGMRFRMMFETEDSSVRRYMGTVTGISDLDPLRWKNSQWHNLQYEEQRDLQQWVDGSSNLSLPSKQLHQVRKISVLDNQKSPRLVRTQSSLSGTKGPSSSNFPSPNSHIVSLCLNGKTQQGSAILVEETVAPPVDNMLQELQSKPEVMVKHEQFSFNESKLPNQLPTPDQLDASSTTSFCLDSKVHEGSSLPPHCLDGNGQDHRDNFLLGAVPDTLLSRGLGTGKEIQNLISGYWQQKDVDTELSTADISSQSFGVADMSFKPGCSTDAVVNEGVPNRGAWANQPQRMRTYTKVCYFPFILE
ncbi:hypothetical protein GW17_00000916 [Ensete ventricosum]|nr:hypothetical protein GW17_00000916 [Ensete ventricosum]